MKENISQLRAHYEGETLDEKTVCPDPLDQFTTWFNEALSSKVNEPNAMILATAATGGFPSVRTVLLKDFDVNGFTFYTNYNSKKGKELSENPKASVLFFWPQLHRQIRIDGIASKIDPAISEAYFKERPRGNRISAWASDQSHVVESKVVLEKKYEALEEKFKDQDIPFPAFWGGYCLKPLSFEFWQGQPNRFHDRVVYSIHPENASWLIKRWAP